MEGMQYCVLLWKNLLTRLFMLRSLKGDKQRELALIRQASPSAKIAYGLAQAFLQLIWEQTGPQLDTWLNSPLEGRDNRASDPCPSGGVLRLGRRPEMERTILERSAQRATDEVFGNELTAHGYRSPMHPFVLPSTIRNIRLTHRECPVRHQSHPRPMTGHSRSHRSTKPLTLLRNGFMIATTIAAFRSQGILGQTCSCFQMNPPHSNGFDEKS